MGRKVGEHDFVMPKLDSQEWATTLRYFRTFSVGVFLWIPTRAKGGIKRGKAKVRVSGPVSYEGLKLVYDKALEVANALDAGTYAGPKMVRVGT